MAEDPGEIREAIAQTREDLAQTIQALGEKADVKQQAGKKLEEVKASAADTMGKVEDKIPSRARPVVAAAGVAILVLVVRRRRRRRSAS